MRMQAEEETRKSSDEPGRTTCAAAERLLNRLVSNPVPTSLGSSACLQLVLNL